MHKTYLLVVALFILSSVTAQQAIKNQLPEDPNSPAWIDMMQDNDVNIYDVQKSFNSYFANRSRSKGDGYKPYKRWEHYMLQRVDSDGNRPSPTSVMKEYNTFVSVYGKGNQKSTSGTWTEFGPTVMPTNGTGQPNGMGRVNAIAFHPTNANIFYIAAPSGGVWKTTNGGSTWTPLTDTLPTLGASSILVHPTNPSIIYVGTGDRDGNDAPGLGVIKSTDSGQTWSFANTGMGTKTVSDMIMHPTNSSIIIAATNGGVYKTTNGGTSWSKTSTSSSHFKDLAFKPSDPTTVYASGSGFFYKSTNTGGSWSAISSGLPSSGRYVIGVSAASASTVYIVSGGSNGLIGVYRSTNSGTSFTSRATSPNILGYSNTGSDTKSQAWYDLALAVDPANANTIYVGGINIWKSTNGGTSWAINAHWVGSGGVPAVHADIHSLDFSPVNSRLYCGNDGGLYYTTNGGTSWPEITSGLGISQIYKIGQSATQTDLIINGYQDNGTAIYDNGSWATEIGGDGMECLIDYSNTNYMYGSLYYGNIRRSSNGGTSFNEIAGDQVNGITEGGGWVSPFILDVNTPGTMYIGLKNLWRSTNVKASSTSSVTWSKLTNNLGGTNSYNLNVIEHSEANANILYFSRADKKLFRSDNISGSTPSFTDLTSNLPQSSYTPKDIEAHPTNQSIVYMTLNKDVYKSTNKGSSWTSISGNLPNISMNCIVYDTSSTNEALYVGTDAGVYYKDNSMTNWVLYMDGMPSAAEVTELEIFYHSNSTLSKISAATYGRGLWQSDLYSSGLATPLADFGWSDEIICTNDTIWFTDSTQFSPTSWSWSFNPSTVTFVNGTSASSQNPVVKFGTAGYYAVTLTATNANGNNSKTISNLIKAGGYKTPFLEEFEPTSTTLGDWGIGNPDNLTTWALANVTGNGSSTRSLYMDNYNYNGPGERDNLFSPLLNLSGMTSASLKFKHAYTRYANYDSDSLVVYISNNCGATWTNIKIYSETGIGDFATAPDTTYEQTVAFSPTLASDWCGTGVGADCDSIDLSTYAGDANVQIVFQAINSYSNNLYLDDISVTGTVTISPIASFTYSPSAVCVGTLVNFTNTSQNATSYIWKENGVVTGSTTQLSKSFTTSGTYQIRLIAINGAQKDSTSVNIIVSSSPSIAVAPTGLVSICNNAGTTPYSTSGAANATSYIWTLTPGTAGTVSGTGTTATVTWNSTFQGAASLSVKGNNSCGQGSNSTPLSISILAGPGNASAPTGLNTVCAGQANVSYTTSTILHAITYTWTLTPANAGTLVGTSNTVSINWSSSFVGNATLGVQGVNGCGNGVASPTLSIAVTQDPSAPALPNGPISLCKGTANSSYTISPVTSANTYTWNLSPASAGSISGTGISSTVQWDAQFVGTAYIHVSGTNNCGTGPNSSDLAIQINDNPNTPTVTQSTDTLFSSSSSGNQWYKSTGIINGATNSIYIPTSNGTYHVTVTNGAGCSSQSANHQVINVSISQSTDGHELRIYPNPAKDIIVVEYDNDTKMHLRLINVLGQTLYSSDFKGSKKIDISTVSNGVYFIELIEKGNSESSIQRKVIVYKN